MTFLSNPFNELYVTETIQPDQFVRLFSPVLVGHVSELFLPGNVVLQGVQGSGKSMLLSLLRPQVRLAYHNAQQPFPIPLENSRFISAGINLTTSRAIDFGQRPIMSPNNEPLPLFFADFLNYWVVADLLRTLDIFAAAEDTTFIRKVGVCLDEARINDFARRLATDECWFGYLDGCHSYVMLKRQIAARITQLRAFLNFNRNEIDHEIISTKTHIGDPIAQTVEAMRTEGILATDVNVFVRIDQYEELWALEAVPNTAASGYRAIVNKALGLRGSSVSYRIGTRRYAWNEDFAIFGTRAKLEQERNYKLIDLDAQLRRKENRKDWIFPQFAEDVFLKRLAFAKYKTKSANLLNRVFGNSTPPEEKARSYCKDNPTRAVKLEPDWPPSWKEFLIRLASENPLQARFADAWARQAHKSDVVNQIPTTPFPWETKKYWIKERVEEALMQIAGRAAQRMVWNGKDDVLQLSGGNVLVFVSICQHIWAAWLRTVRGDEGHEPPTIAINEQAVGIHEASRLWFNKIKETPQGDRRQRFIALVGSMLERRLYNDAALSKPGENGFSVSLEDLSSDAATTSFLNEMVYFGDLFDSPHTTKSKDRKPRRKWYLNPVLSPYFRLFHKHPKEPWYVTVADVKEWLTESDRVRALSSPGHSMTTQPFSGQIALSFLDSDSDA